MHHSIYRHNIFIFSTTEHGVGDDGHYRLGCQREDNDRNRHRRKMLVIDDSDVTLVTKQSRIDGGLDEGVAVWIMTFPTLPSFLWTEWVQCPSGRKVSCV